MTSEPHTLCDARRPWLLDLFCGAGGASRGYQSAGFAVVGVDIAPQPRYPKWEPGAHSQFFQADALDVLHDMVANGRGRFAFAGAGPGGTKLKFDAIHASPPCQAFTSYRRKGHGVGDGYPNLIPTVRDLLQQTSLPYVIENVEEARDELREPITLCGSMFGLDVRRHRLFETDWPLAQLPCDHASQIAKGKQFPGATNRDGRYTCEIGVWRIPLDAQQRAMGIDWMEREELSQAIPPAYTAFVGDQLLTHFQHAREVA